MTINMALGYIFTVLNYIFYCSSRFFGKKRKMLLFDLFAKLSTIIALFFLGSISGAYSMLISFCILIAGNIKERKGRKWIGLFIVFEAVLIFIMIARYEGISSVFVFLTATLSLISIWWLKPQHMRIASMGTSGFSLLYQLSIQNWAGLLEIIVIVSNVVSYVKFRMKKKTE